jgi:splicing factor 3B subunit 4
MHSIADADYAQKIMNGVKMFGRPIRVNKVGDDVRCARICANHCVQSNRDKRAIDVGANLFIGNLDPDIDENVLHQVRLPIGGRWWVSTCAQTFSTFGTIVQAPKIMRDPETGASRGFAFIRCVCTIIAARIR